VRVTTVSDQYGALHRAGGIDVAALRRYVADAGAVLGFPGADPLDQKESLFAADVDLLVPAAVEGSFTRGTRRRQGRRCGRGCQRPDDCCRRPDPR
jgi:glutamate dehydrogenase (NAD(P)+)